MSNLWEWAEVAPGAPGILTALTSEEIRALCALAKERDCLEVGSAFGYSAIMMAASRANSVTSVDFHQPCSSNCQAVNSHEVMQGNIRVFLPGREQLITVIRDLSQEALPGLAREGRRFGLVFIDGDHSYESVRHDAAWARRLVAGGGFIACHDYGASGIASVTRAVDEVFPAGPGRLAGTLHITGPHTGGTVE